MRTVTALMRILAALLLALGFAGSPALAEDARYSFASAQGGERIVIPQGGEGTGALFFYNLDGNRITHITLSVSETPPGFTARLEPAVHEVQVELDGQVQVVRESLYVEPGVAFAEPQTDLPPEATCIELPGRGFVVAKAARLVISGPADAKPGSVGKTKVTAEAAWLGQTGAGVIRQSRDFTFAVEVGRSGPPTERVLGETSREQQAALGPLDMLARTLTDAAPAFAAGALAVLGLVRVTERVRRRRGRE